MTREKMGRIACITGASSGIGEAVARLLAQKGYHLLLGARRQEKLKLLAQELEILGASSVVYEQLDVQSPEAIKEFVNRANTSFPEGIDILVNNAGLALGRDQLVEGREADWEVMIATNLLGVARLTKAFLPGMLKNGSGHIVIVGSIAGHQVYEGGAVYSASKFGVRAIAETLKLELNGTGIRISSVDPGMVNTEFSMVRFNQDSERANGVYRGMTPLSAGDVAESIVFVVERPAHVNIDQIILTPTDQATVSKIHRQ